MAKYLLLKHYRGAPAPLNDVPMDRWLPDEVDAHMQYMNDFAARLQSRGELIEGRRQTDPRVARSQAIHGLTAHHSWVANPPVFAPPSQIGLPLCTESSTPASRPSTPTTW